jgi:hypothetical protein
MKTNSIGHASPARCLDFKEKGENDAVSWKSVAKVDGASFS